MDEWMEGRKETHRMCSFRHFKHDGGSSFSRCFPHQTTMCVQSIPAGHNSASSIPSPTSMARTRNYHQSNPNSPHRSHRDRRRWPPPASTTAAKRINTSTSPPPQEQEQEHAHDTARCQLPSIDSASVCFFVICIRHRRLISSSVQHHPVQSHSSNGNSHNAHTNHKTPQCCPLMEIRSFDQHHCKMTTNRPSEPLHVPSTSSLPTRCEIVTVCSLRCADQVVPLLSLGPGKALRRQTDETGCTQIIVNKNKSSGYAPSTFPGPVSRCLVSQATLTSACRCSWSRPPNLQTTALLPATVIAIATSHNHHQPARCSSPIRRPAASILLSAGISFASYALRTAPRSFHPAACWPPPVQTAS
ncbi:hypothetical protein CCHR01_15671 [Colletotrichum chrysophilum]|uniref:Uncharacterized protein n=1 Tax=Colletotrichum chrysophilum TaxID=1836956 RepID=A0AAD9E8H1_9PEZI|nr:hypothetical protein CCHR01_15671 [Colletotrichum chrysophilum]